MTRPSKAVLFIHLTELTGRSLRARAVESVNEVVARSSVHARHRSTLVYVVLAVMTLWENKMSSIWVPSKQ